MRKKYPYLLAVIFVLAGLILNACQPYPEEPTKEERTMEEKEFEEYEVISPQDGIEGFVTVPWQGKEVIFETMGLEEVDEREVKELKSPFDITVLLFFFEILDPETKEPISHFDPAIELRVELSEKRWEETLAYGGEYPRLAYLVRKDGEWASAWIPFTEEQIVDFEPPGEGPGYLMIRIESWGDPLIGGF